MTLSRSIACSYCGNSAEDENGKFFTFAADCKDQKCSRVNEPHHWHTTYSKIACHSCHKEILSGQREVGFVG